VCECGAMEEEEIEQQNREERDKRKSNMRSN
jgi:hypothetical protein